MVEDFPDIQQCTAHKISKVRFRVREVRSLLKRFDSSKGTWPEKSTLSVLKL